MSGSTGFAPIPLYLSYSTNESTYAANSLKANPQATALANYFQTNAANITSPAALLKDYKALTVVLGAFGLQGAINNTAVLQKLLTQDPAASNSLARQLGSPKYLLFAQALSTWSPPPFASASARAQIVSSYTTNTFEKTADTQAPGLANALYFTREASSIKSITALQSDTSLLAVVVTTLGVPYEDFGALDFTAQTAFLKKNVDLSKFQNPTSVKQTAEQYLVQQQQDAVTTTDPGTLESLYDDGSDTSGDSLLSILNPGSTTDSSSSSGNLLSLFA